MSNATSTGRWVSLEQAAASIAISRATVYRLIDRGHVATTKVGTRRLVSLDSLDAHLERCRQDLVAQRTAGLSADPT